MVNKILKNTNKTKKDKVRKNINSIKGGNFGKLNLYSFNVLNPNPKVTKMLYCNNMSFTNDERKDDICKTYLPAADSIRFIDFREQALINIIQHWLKDPNAVVCLQEINDTFLTRLKNIFSTNNKLSSTTFEEKAYYKDCRVTILGANYSFTKVNDIEFTNEFEDVNIRTQKKETKTNIKNGLYTQIQDNNNNISYDLFNVHFHFRSNVNDIENYIEQINTVRNIENEFIICGDFNKPFDELDAIFKKNKNLENYILPLGSVFTSFNTETEGKGETGYIDKLIIDYIICSKNCNILDFKILPTVDTEDIKYNLFYDINEIKKLYIKSMTDFKSKLPKTLNTPTTQKKLQKKLKPVQLTDNQITEFANAFSKTWTESRLHSDISDHLPINKTIIFKSISKQNSPKLTQTKKTLYRRKSNNPNISNNQSPIKSKLSRRRTI